MLYDPNSDNLQEGKWIVMWTSKSGDFFFSKDEEKRQTECSLRAALTITAN